MRTRTTNHTNEYAKALKMYAPKTVVEGVLVSFMAMIYGEEILNDSEKCNQLFHDEWQTLYRNGIVPQKPPKNWE
jgi:hypothetical protein